jgi:hypothetical protein
MSNELNTLEIIPIGEGNEAVGIVDIPNKTFTPTEELKDLFENLRRQEKIVNNWTYQDWHTFIFENSKINSIFQKQGCFFHYNQFVEYFINAFVIDNATGNIYKSLVDENKGNLLSNIVKWELQGNLNLINKLEPKKLENTQNFIVNGDFSVWQRGTSFDKTGIFFVADNWFARRYGNLIVEKIQGETSLNAIRLKIDSNNTDTDVFRVNQIIDSKIVNYLAGKNVTVSFKTRLGSGFADTDNRISLRVEGNELADVWGNPNDDILLKDLFIPGNNIFLVGALSSTEKNVWNTISRTFTIPLNIKSMFIRLDSYSTSQAGDLLPVVKGEDFYFDIADVKLELGIEATPFVPNINDEAIAKGYFLNNKNYLPKQIILSNNIIDPNNDINFSEGNFVFSDNSGFSNLSGITKRLDANWVAGTNQGGLDTGSKAISTWYYCYAIYNPISNISDVIFSINNTTLTLPSGFTKYKYIGAFKTNVSGNIIGFNQFGNDFEYKSPINDGTSTGGLVTLSIPNIPTEVNTFIAPSLISGGQGCTYAIKSFYHVDNGGGANASSSFINGLMWHMGGGSSKIITKQTITIVILDSSVQLNFRTHGYRDLNL